MILLPNHALQPTADRRVNLHMTASTLKFVAQLGVASRGELVLVRRLCQPSPRPSMSVSHV